jgi:hypothetical protein
MKQKIIQKLRALPPIQLGVITIGVVIVIAAPTGYVLSSSKSNANAPLKTSQKSKYQAKQKAKPVASEAATTPTPDSEPTSPSSSGTSTNSSSTPAPASSSSSTPRATGPPAGSFTITSASISTNFSCAVDPGYSGTSANPQVSLPFNHPSGTINWRFEYQGDLAGIAYDNTDHSESVPASNTVFYPGNSVPPGTWNYSHGTSSGYQVRIHVTAPNDISSSWASVPAGSC